VFCLVEQQCVLEDPAAECHPLKACSLSTALGKVGNEVADGRVET
jgi:hypothetical protein